MSNPEWRRNRPRSRPATEARLHAHYAAQWLARAARAYILPQLDDSHTNLGWDRMLGGFVTHPLPDGMRLGLRSATCVWCCRRLARTASLA